MLAKRFPSTFNVRYLGLILNKRLTRAEQKRVLLNSERKSLFYSLLGKHFKLSLKNKLLCYTKASERRNGPLDFNYSEI